MKRRALVTSAAVLGLALAGVTSPVLGAGTSQDGYDYAFSGSGQQYGEWSVIARRLRLKTMPSTGMGMNRCMDAMLDWERTSHWDSRVVRSCRPGYSQETEPNGGNGYWSETESGFATTTGTQKGYGYVIDDSNLSVTLSERFESVGDCATSACDLPATAPGTGTQGYARVRTLYQNGSVLSCNPLPSYSASGSGGCS